MNYQEATDIVSAHSHLIGTEYNRKTISALLIAPLREVGIAKLMYNYANEIDSTPFYANFTEFEVWVIFDVEDWLLTGVIDKMRLSQYTSQVAQL